MRVKGIKVGPLKCNCYILEIDKKLLVVDPGDEYDKIKREFVGKEVLGVLNTHSHFDHVGCIRDVVNDYGVKVYDYDNLKESEYVVGPFVFNVIYTPGHNRDSIVFYFKEDKVMFTGDFLFYNTVGRCDLFGSSVDAMRESIDKIRKYPSDIKVYPGHGRYTTLGRECKYNPYFD